MLFVHPTSGILATLIEECSLRRTSRGKPSLGGSNLTVAAFLFHTDIERCRVGPLLPSKILH